MPLREILKKTALLAATIAIAPELMSYWIRARIVGRDRALEGSSQLLARLPGISGQYLRRAFFGHVLARCHPSSTIEYGTLFSQVNARIDENAYVGPDCHLGSVHVGRDVLIAAGVHVPSGRHTHRVDATAMAIRDQGENRQLVRIGAGSWIGAAAVVMADVGCNSIVGAGAVVTKPIPDSVVAAGVPARVVRSRAAADVAAATPS